MKRFLCLVACFTMCGAFVQTVNAEEAICADEKKNVAVLNKKVLVQNKKVSDLMGHKNQAETFLKTKDIEENVVIGIPNNMQSVKTVLKENNATNFNDIKGSVASDIFAKTQAAAAKVSVTSKLNAESTVKVINKDDYSVMLVVTGAIALILAGVSFVTSENGYFAKLSDLNIKKKR